MTRARDRRGGIRALGAFACAAACMAGCGAAGAEDPRSRVGDPAAGRLAIREHGCGACHTIPGVAGPRGIVGPPLEAWSRHVYIAGVLPNEPELLVRWIVDPPALVPGTAMPAMGVSEREARDIAAYLYRLE